MFMDSTETEVGGGLLEGAGRSYRSERKLLFTRCLAAACGRRAACSSSLKRHRASGCSVPSTRILRQNARSCANIRMFGPLFCCGKLVGYPNTRPGSPGRTSKSPNSYRMREHRELRESMRRAEGGDGPRQGEKAP